MKELLAVPSSVSVFIQFADPPHSAISSLHTVLEVPAHVVNLTVSPLPSVHAGHTLQPSAYHDKLVSTDHSSVILQAKDERDPYCRYRDMYQNLQRSDHRAMAGQCSSVSRRSSGYVRQKCDFAEMNRLLFQLTEVSLSLQRTKEECDMIAKRCPPKPKDRRMQMKDSINGCHSTEEVDVPASATVKENAAAVIRELCSDEERATDRKIEELIHKAHSLTQSTTQSRRTEEQRYAPVAGEIMALLHNQLCAGGFFAGGTCAN